MDKIQKKCFLRARLVSLISAQTKEYIFGRHLCEISAFVSVHGCLVGTLMALGHLRPRGLNIQQMNEGGSF